MTKPVLVFAGPDDEQANDGTLHRVILTCPDLGARFTAEVHLADVYGGTVTRVEMVGEDTAGLAETKADPKPDLEDLLDEAAVDWVKDSATVSRDYSKSMITTCTGALPIFFAVLKFVYGERAGSSTWVLAGVVPAVAFLAAAMAFVFALQPRLLACYSVNDLTSRHQQRHRQMNRWNTAGTILFLVGAGGAATVWLAALG